MDLFLVELPVSDWHVSLTWYRDRLGLSVLHLDSHNQYALLAAGPARIALKHGPTGSKGIVVTFHVSDLDAELARLAGRGVTPDTPVEKSAEGYRVARLNDPDGHRLAIFEWVPRASAAPPAV